MGRVEMTWTFTRSTPLRAAAGPSSPRTAREHRRGTRYSIVAIRRSSFAAVCAGSVRDYVEMKVCTLLTQPASAALICFITCGIGVDPLCWMMSRTLALIALRAFFFGSHLEKISVPFPPPGTAQVEPKEPGGLPLQRVHHPRQLPVQLHAQRRKLFMKPLQGALRPSPFAAVAADGDDHIIGEPVIGLRAHQQFCDPIRRPDAMGFCRGRPLGRGTRTWSSMASASVTSAGEHFPTELPTEHLHRLPIPSTLCLYHAWFCRPRRPFFAGAKLPSRKASSHFNKPSSSNAPSNVRQTRSQTPTSSHCFSRRQQVDREGYSSGRKCHAALVCNTHKMPTRQPRFGAAGLPRLSLRRFGSGNWGPISSRCSS